MKTESILTKQIGNHQFYYVCMYSDCYKKNERNNYSVIRKRNLKKGLYAFVYNGIVIYIGVAYSRSITDRVVQHFRKDSGGIRNKLDKSQKRELEKSDLYVCEIQDTNQNLLFEEALLIGKYRPKLNFIKA